jgi:hypothetical protein
VLTSEVPIAEIFTGEDPLKLGEKAEGHENVDHGMRSLMDDLGISMDALLESSIFVLPPLNVSNGRRGRRKNLLLHGRYLD